jgi:hypothetical protein
MSITEFSQQRRLNTKHQHSTVIIPGKHGHLYEFDDSCLGVMFMPPSTPDDPWGKWTPKQWGNFRRAGTEMGMTVIQDGDSEGCLAFDPSDKKQAEHALKVAGVKPTRRLPEHLEVFAYKRKSHAVAGHLGR